MDKIVWPGQIPWRIKPSTKQNKKTPLKLCASDKHENILFPSFFNHCFLNVFYIHLRVHIVILGLHYWLQFKEVTKSECVFKEKKRKEKENKTKQKRKQTTLGGWKEKENKTKENKTIQERKQNLTKDSWVMKRKTEEKTKQKTWVLLLLQYTFSEPYLNAARYTPLFIVTGTPTMQRGNVLTWRQWLLFWPGPWCLKNII